LTQKGESFLTRQGGQTCTSAIPPNKRPVDNTLRLDGELCLKLSVGKASVKPITERKNLIPKHQFGFRSKHSAID